MTPQMEQAIQLAQSLSSTEQMDLLKLLSAIVQKANLLEVQNQAFWRSPSLKELIQEQQPVVVTDLSALGIDFWDSDNSSDEFLVSPHSLFHHRDNLQRL